MRITKRSHIINYLIKLYKYKRYLEIGVRTPSCNFDKIKCKFKVGVDINPASRCRYTMTSDMFFQKISPDKMYDIIFIDALHLKDSVLKDVTNSLKHLSSGGVIVMHDCNPTSNVLQRVPKSDRKRKWNGDVWKAFAILRMTREDLNMYVVNINQGCGIVRKGKQKLFEKVKEDCLTYSFLVKKRKKLLNLVSTAQFRKKEKKRRGV